MRGAPITESEAPRFLWSPIEGMHVSTSSKGKTKECELRESLEALAEDVFNSSGKTELRYTDMIEGIKNAKKIKETAAEGRLKLMRDLKLVLKIPQTGNLMLNPI